MGSILDQAWQYVWDYILRDGVLIIAVCIAVGWVLKHKTKVNNDNIPIICCLIGALYGLVIPGVYEEDPLVIGVIKSAIDGIAATGVHQIIKCVIRSYLGKIKSEVPDTYNE